MTTTTLKALLAGSIFATTASTFVLAQDATGQAHADMALTPPENTQPDDDVQTDMSTDAKTDIESEDEVDAETNTIIQSNEDVMGAIETGDDDALEKDVFSPSVEDEKTNWQGSEETEMDGVVDPDTDLNVETDKDVSNPD